jgi:excisionase family DNA binding protein
MSIAAVELPEVLTIDEAARLLRIGRNSAYALAREWLASGGAHGLPVVKLGRSLRVPRAALQRMLGAAGGGPSIVPPHG